MRIFNFLTSMALFENVSLYCTRSDHFWMFCFYFTMDELTQDAISIMCRITDGQAEKDRNDWIPWMKKWKWNDSILFCCDSIMKLSFFFLNRFVIWNQLRFSQAITLYALTKIDLIWFYIRMTWLPVNSIGY